jgi:hypothetical protein
MMINVKCNLKASFLRPAASLLTQVSKAALPRIVIRLGDRGVGDMRRLKPRRYSKGSSLHE